MFKHILISTVFLLLSKSLQAAVPEVDPPLQGAPVNMVASLKDVHPRVWFTQDDLLGMKAVYNSEAGRPFREALEAYLPSCNPPDDTKWIINATDAQRQGYWRLPTVVLHYALTGDKASFDKAKGFMEVLLDQAHWQTGKEVDSGMGAANMMVGAGMALDVLWHDLDPDFRERFRKKCLLQARRMYHLGHLMEGPDTHYWQGDPANNHRWHRNAGLASCLFAAYTGVPEEQWLMTQFKKEMDYVVRWLPQDGTSHESPSYMTFGISHLIVGVQAAGRCYGESYLQHDFFKNVPKFKTLTLTPDFKNVLHYGDQGGTGLRKLNYDMALYKCTSVHNLKIEQALLDRRVKEYGPGWGWMGVLWYNPDVSGADVGELPVSAFFEDIGVLVARDQWTDDGTALLFKCGPLGGYTLNKFRNDNNFKYINVAHDDPDANSFIVYSNGAFLAESDRYSEHKKSANFNTILINGIGQQVPGQAEDRKWSQPATGPFDMTQIANVTALKQTPNIDVIAGEAGHAYNHLQEGGTRHNGRPELNRYRRCLTFVRGDYVLVLDDIRAPEVVDIDWLMQGQDLEVVNEAEGRYKLISEKGPRCSFQLQTSADAGLSLSIVDSPADTKKKVLGWKQLRGRATTDHLYTASIYDLYGKSLSVRLDAKNPEAVIVAVRGIGINDSWLWEPAKAAGDTYTLSGKRGEKNLITVNEQDRPRDVMAHLDEVFK